MSSEVVNASKPARGVARAHPVGVALLAVGVMTAATAFIVKLSKTHKEGF